MKELSLNILDIAKNSVTAGATLVEITVDEQPGRLTIGVSDNGCGMDADFLARVMDPFTTTRTTRKVGLGIPLLRMPLPHSSRLRPLRSSPRSRLREPPPPCSSSCHRRYSS